MSKYEEALPQAHVEIRIRNTTRADCCMYGNPSPLTTLGGLDKRSRDEIGVDTQSDTFVR